MSDFPDELPTAADEQEKPAGNRAVKIASGISITLGAIVGLVVAVVLVGGMWLLFLGMLIAAPPLEFLDRIEEVMSFLFWVSLALLVGLPIVGGMVLGAIGGSTTAMIRAVRHNRQQRAAEPELFETEEPIPLTPAKVAPRPPSAGWLIGRSVLVWWGVMIAAVILGAIALASVPTPTPGESPLGFALLVITLFFGHVGATYLAFALLLPKAGLLGWWRGEMGEEGMVVAPVLPAFLFGTAVCLFIYLAAFTLTSLLLLSEPLTPFVGLIILAAVPLGLVLSGVLGYTTYRRSSAGNS